VIQPQRTHRYLGRRGDQGAVDRIGAGGVVRDTQNEHLRTPVLPQLRSGRIIPGQRRGDERLRGLVDRERWIDDGESRLEQERGHFSRGDLAASLFLNEYHRPRQLTFERDPLSRGSRRHGG